MPIFVRYEENAIGTVSIFTSSEWMFTGALFFSKVAFNSVFFFFIGERERSMWIGSCVFFYFFFLSPRHKLAKKFSAVG